MPTLVIRSPDGREERRPFESAVKLGRSPDNDVVLTQGGVSRWHAKISISESGVVAEDLQSANGTWVDGKRITQATPVSTTSTIVVGDYELRVEPSIDETQAPRVVGKRKATAKAAMAELRVLNGQRTGHVFVVSGRSSIGRVPSNAVAIDDSSVSREHAEIDLSGQHAVVRDLASANGTFVNGVRVDAPVQLRFGDVVQVGAIEFLFERVGATIEPSGEAGPLARWWKKTAKWHTPAAFVLLVIVSGTFAALGMQWWMGQDAPTSGATVATPGVAKPIDAMLAQCRHFTATEVTDEELNKARAACDRALAIDPINQEAMALQKRIDDEKSCLDAAAHGRTAMRQYRNDEALELFAKVRPHCGAYLKIKPMLQDAIEGARRQAAEDCRSYSGRKQWGQALERCGQYMRYACQAMSEQDLYPPAGGQLRLSGALRKGDWRPKDPLYIAYLVARQNTGADPALWRCPKVDILAPTAVQVDPMERARAVLAKRYPDADLNRAITLYYEGKLADAVILLQRLRELPEKAGIHAEADTMRRLVQVVEQSYKEGQGELQSGELERADAPLREALAADDQLIRGASASVDAPPAAGERLVSTIRRNIQQDASARAYAKGKMLMDRQDAVSACRAWKFGYAFWKGNTDLLRALTNVCTKRASDGLTQAESCEQLAAVLVLAVDGDGIREQVEERRTTMQCPPSQ